MITTLRFSVVGMSAFGGSLMTGGASALPRNAVGFVFALQRKLKAKNLSLGDDFAVAVGVDSYRLHKTNGGATTPKMALSTPWDRTKSSVENKISVLDYELKADCAITLAILSDGVCENDALERAIRNILPAMRFTNGSVFIDPQSCVRASTQDDSAALAEGLKAVRSRGAWFFVDRSDLLQPGREVESFVEALSLFKQIAETPEPDEPPVAKSKKAIKAESAAEEVRNVWYRKYPGWLVPLERGYQALTQPVAGRPGARDNTTPAVIASAVIGLGELVSRKHLLGNLSLPSFWRSSSVPTERLYLYSAHPFI